MSRFTGWRSLRRPFAAAAAAAVAFLGACSPDQTGPDEQREEARPRPLAAYAPGTQPHAFVGKVIRIYSAHNGANCLYYPTVFAGQDVLHRSCRFTDFEKFRVEQAPGRADKSLVVLRSNREPALCLDVEWGTANGGERLQLFPCHYGPNQVFQLPPKGWPLGGGFTQGPIYTENSGLRLVLDAYIPFSTGIVQQYQPHGGNNQKWWFQDASTLRWL